ncbi:MAG: SDR family oxidoreductase [Candidatus Aminicenantes bacterium]|nr:SDR family oxidoreductase [Candidatus Aminicenantes bacterium]
MKINLISMNVLVTGASRGIGRAISQYLGEAGATLAIHYNKNQEAAVELARMVGNASKVFQANLENPEECFTLFEEIEEKLGPVHVLVNNAGVAIKSPLDLPGQDWVEQWERTMRVNLTSVGLLCKAAVERFLTRSGGRIINIASRAAFRGDTSDYLAYAASKGGVVALTRSLARAYGKKGIKAFVVAPGFVRTDMAQEFFDTYGEEIALNDIALPELTEPDDVAPMVAFLASGMADHATGGTFDINAGSYVH